MKKPKTKKEAQAIDFGNYKSYYDLGKIIDAIFVKYYELTEYGYSITLEDVGWDENSAPSGRWVAHVNFYPENPNSKCEPIGELFGQSNSPIEALGLAIYNTVNYINQQNDNGHTPQK